ncbi:tyrosine-type recombinase/integrase [Micromonospora sp. NPDC047730]|uniref:tyrosine-type recombinase/integrase n=1 Tax=Micromonospora sp. NPDC047730 TaxID=3364253 RepID=UPI00371AB914
MLRLHTETACRRGGALGLRLADLDTDCGLLRLTEKGATLRWQPITLDLAAHLDEHARARGAVLPTDLLLRYRNGRAITSRRYDHLWKRIGQQLPWVAAQGISTHWLRHTTLTWVERHFGYGIARAYAGHTDSHRAGHHHIHQSRPPCRGGRASRHGRPTTPARRRRGPRLRAVTANGKLPATAGRSRTGQVRPVGGTSAVGS